MTDDAPLCLPPNPLGRRPAREMPDGTIDCHFHVIGTGTDFAPARSYTPRPAPLEGWLALAEHANFARGVLVQPSVYGFDNSVLLDAMAAAPDRLRAIVVIPPDTGDAELERLHGLGVRGVRINSRNRAGLPFDALATLAARIAPLSWMLQFLVYPDQLREIGSLVRTLPLPVVIDHFGLIPLGLPESFAALRDLQALLDAPNAYVKISAPYRVPGGYDAVGAATVALAASHPDRLLWGTDWPHTELWANVPDDADLIDMTMDWLGDDATRRQVFVTTPQTLYFS